MKQEILGVKINKITWEQTLQKIKSFLDSPNQHYLVTPNPEFLVAAQDDPEFKNILNQADLAVPDGFGLKLAGLYLGRPLRDRITGVDLVNQIAKICQQEKKSVYLYGAQPGIAEKTAQKLVSKYPSLKITGYESGFRTRFYWRLPNFLILAKIRRTRPDVLLVALGAPKQEKWIYHNLAKLPSVKLAMGVGGAFDFISGKIKRSPKFMRCLGLEWLWRFGKQPWRLKRILTAIGTFSWLVIKKGRKS